MTSKIEITIKKKTILGMKTTRLDYVKKENKLNLQDYLKITN